MPERKPRVDLNYDKAFNPVAANRREKEKKESAKRKKQEHFKIKEKLGLQRRDRQENITRIELAVTEYIDKYNKFPTNKAIAEATNLNVSSVAKYLKEVSWERWFEPIKQKMTLAAPDIMMALIKKAKTGDTNAIKLYAQLSGYVEKKEVKKDIAVDIRINKRVIGSPEDFKNIENADFEDVHQLEDSQGEDDE